jgi:hypothetical protein
LPKTLQQIKARFLFEAWTDGDEVIKGQSRTRADLLFASIALWL